jgi:hypothetical protein
MSVDASGHAGVLMRVLPNVWNVRQPYIMKDHRLTDVTVCCRGIAVGTAPLLLRTETSGRQGFRIGPANHLPAYEELIGRALRAYKEAKARWACMPYPQAAVAHAGMAEAWNVLAELWASLDLRDATGAVLPVPVERFSERVVTARFGDVPATILAQLRERYCRAEGPPAT